MTHTNRSLVDRIFVLKRINIGLAHFIMIFASILALGADQVHSPQSDIEGCLFANTRESFRKESCATDPIGLAKNPLILKTIAELSLTKTAIKFVGCATASFATAMGPPRISSRSYVIYYPILSGVAIGDYIAPLTHELSHVFQMESVGGYGKLVQSTTSKRRELGADFIAGILFSKLLNGESSYFLNNLNLIGRYREMDSSAHGTPSQRAAAFRNGQILPFGEFDNDMVKAYAEFQENRYGSIENQ